MAEESIEVRVARIEERQRAEYQRVEAMTVKISECRQAIKDLATTTDKSIRTIAEASESREKHAAVTRDRVETITRLVWLIGAGIGSLALKGLWEWAQRR